MKFDGIQNNFTSGEISPTLWGQVELERYKFGAAIVENMVVQPHGGLEKRGGSHFVAEVKDSSKVTRVIDFNYEDAYEYTLEFGDLYIRVFVDGVPVMDGASPYEIVTTYTEAELSELWLEDKDTNTFYILHKDHAPAKLTRSAHDTWTLADVVFTFDGGHDWVANDYPTLSWFYEQRHFFAATPTTPNGIWASQSASDTDMQLGTGLDDEGIEIVVKAAVKFVWASAGREILLGGTNAEFSLASNALNEAITPSNIRPTVLTKYGSVFTTPTRIDDSVVYLQKGSRKIRRLASNFQSGSYSDSYAARNISILSSHITKSGIVGAAHATLPDSVIWGYRTDGELVCVTYEPDHQIFGWHRHKISGTDAKVKSLAINKAIEGGTQDKVWLIVERTIDEVTVQYIEYIIPGLTDEDDVEDAFFVDSGVTKTGSGFTTVDGLDHLEGEEVTILADGAKQAPKTVSVGEITLDSAADVANVGLKIPSIVETLPIEGGNPEGTSQTKTKRVITVSLRLNRSLGFFVGDVYGNLDQYYFGPPELMDQAIPLFTGDTDPMPFPGGYDRQSRIKILHEEPLPFNLLAIVYEAKTK